jgi:hypothetical protein
MTLLVGITARTILDLHRVVSIVDNPINTEHGTMQFEMDNGKVYILAMTTAERLALADLLGKLQAMEVYRR